MSLKIARHSSCSVCGTCTGLRPPRDVDVVLDDSKANSYMGGLEQYGSDDDDEMTQYLDTCMCGHGVREHGTDASELGGDEFKRRGRVAVRLDELLKVRVDSHSFPPIHI